MSSLVRLLAALLALAAIGLALWQIKGAEQGVARSSLVIDGVPATVFRQEGGGASPAVVIAHGFAGSQQLMHPFALSLARNGYIAVTFDFAGHGRNPNPMSGDLDDLEGATRRLLQDMQTAANHAAGLSGGRLAVLGHSMASDIVVRHAVNDPRVAATVVVSSFSPAITATAPRNLLLIAGAWEGMLKTEALRVTGLVSAPAAAEAGVTYGDFAQGTARRAAFSPHTEHVSVLYSEASLRESLDWLDRSFGITRPAPEVTGNRGLSILLLFGSVLLLAWPLSSLLPRVCDPPVGAGIGWKRLWPGLVIPMILTPLILRVVPTHFLPVLVMDYLAAHFLLYGVLTGAWLVAQRMLWGAPEPKAIAPTRSFTQALLPVIAFCAIAFLWPLDSFVTSFAPVGDRPLLIAVLLAGTLAYFSADGWMTHGAGAARGGPAASKLAFLVSLGIAVALDPPRLFFLAMIAPVIALLFMVFGLWNRWIYAATGHPLVGGFAAALFFAWAIAVTFPMIGG
jgi:dienelactone hydrolase